MKPTALERNDFLGVGFPLEMVLSVCPAAPDRVLARWGCGMMTVTRLRGKCMTEKGFPAMGFRGSKRGRGGWRLRGGEPGFRDPRRAAGGQETGQGA